MSEHAPNPPACPERIEHPRFVLRCRDEADETRVLGAIGLHRGAAPGTLEIGFWLCRSAEGGGIITEATRILTNLALTRLGAERVQIRCDIRNERSAAVPRRLGYILEATQDEVYEGVPRRAQTKRSLPRLFRVAPPWAGLSAATIQRVLASCGTRAGGAAKTGGAAARPCPGGGSTDCTSSTCQVLCIDGYHACCDCTPDPTNCTCSCVPD